MEENGYITIVSNRLMLRITGEIIKSEKNS